MKQQLKALFELQKLDLEITRINSAIASLDGALALRKQHAAAKKRSDATHQSFIDTEIQLKDRELELKTIDAKRADSEKKLYSGAIMSAKEVSGLEHQISHLKNQQNELDELVLGLYESVESLREQSKSEQIRVEELEQQVREAIAKEAIEKTRLQRELQQLAPQRESAAAEIRDKHLLTRYESIRKKTGGAAVARIMEHKCEGCHVAVTAFTIRNVFEGSGIEYCENCGRILVLETE